MILETFAVGMLQCNCTILASGPSGDAIVVDPGDDPDQIMKRLSRHDLRLRQIVSTHAHIDHVGAIHALQERTGANASLHAHDMFLFDCLKEQASWLGIVPPEQGRIDHFLEDGTPVESGGIALDVVHTPGHTPGSVTFHLGADDPILFTGDTLFLGSIGRTDLPGGSMPDILDSIRRRLLKFRSDTRVIPGHGPETSIGREQAENPFLR